MEELAKVIDEPDKGKQIETAMKKEVAKKKDNRQYATKEQKRRWREQLPIVVKKMTKDFTKNGFWLSRDIEKKHDKRFPEYPLGLTQRVTTFLRQALPEKFESKEITRKDSNGRGLEFRFEIKAIQKSSKQSKIVAVKKAVSKEKEEENCREKIISEPSFHQLLMDSRPKYGPQDIILEPRESEVVAKLRARGFFMKYRTDLLLQKEDHFSRYECPLRCGKDLFFSDLDKDKKQYQMAHNFARTKCKERGLPEWFSLNVMPTCGTCNGNQGTGTFFDFLFNDGKILPIIEVAWYFWQIFVNEETYSTIPQYNFWDFCHNQLMMRKAEHFDTIRRHIANIEYSKLDYAKNPKLIQLRAEHEEIEQEIASLKALQKLKQKDISKCDKRLRSEKIGPIETESASYTHELLLLPSS